jgi:hypothetical protein
MYIPIRMYIWNVHFVTDGLPYKIANESRYARPDIQRTLTSRIVDCTLDVWPGITGFICNFVHPWRADCNVVDHVTSQVIVPRSSVSTPPWCECFVQLKGSSAW